MSGGTTAARLEGAEEARPGAPAEATEPDTGSRGLPAGQGLREMLG